MKKLAIFFTIFMGFCAVAQTKVAQNVQPSFDCQKASTNVEKLICQSNDLSVLDGLLAYAYKSVQTTETNAVKKEENKKEQLGWTKEVRNACKDIVCLKSAYTERISDKFPDFETYNTYLNSLGWTKKLYREGSRFCDFEYKKGSATVVVNAYCAGDGFNTLYVK